MRVLVVGSEYGLGKIVAEHLHYFIGINSKGHQVIESRFDVSDDVAVDKFFIQKKPSQYDAVIYCAGINRIAPFDEATSYDFWDSMTVNCYGFIRVLKAIREKNAWNPGMRACLITSNAANIPMRHSLAYNCSKAAANMAIKQMAREIDPSEMVIFGIAPNKLEGTPMSLEIQKKVCEIRQWTLEQAHQYQIEALPARKETDPVALAQFIIAMIDHEYSPYIHGNILPFGGPV